MYRKLSRLITVAAIAAGLSFSLLTGMASAATAPSGPAVAIGGNAAAPHAIPAHLNTTHEKPVTSPDLAIPAAGCAWYTVAETIESNQNLSMDVAVLGQFNSSGVYCGLASDHVCATPDNNSYVAQGLLIYNWWYANGTYLKTVSNYFDPASGQTECSYSGSFSASRNATATGEFIAEDVPGYQQIVGEYGVEGVF